MEELGPEQQLEILGKDWRVEKAGGLECGNVGAKGAQQLPWRDRGN